MEATIRQTKERIRREILRRRKALEDETVRRKSLAIGQRLEALAEYERSASVLFYLSLPGEVRTDEMIERAMAAGKKVFVPWVDRHHRRLKLSELPGLDVDFDISSFGIREPAQSWRKEAPAAAIECVVTPGLAFDARGGRLGFGVGYYDRLFGELPETARRVAVAFDFQVIDSVPQDESDVPVHTIVTETTTINC